MRGAGYGVREGIGADAPMIFYWEYTQASLKYPYKSKKIDLPDSPENPGIPDSPDSKVHETE